MPNKNLIKAMLACVILGLICFFAINAMAKIKMEPGTFENYLTINTDFKIEKWMLDNVKNIYGIECVNRVEKFSFEVRKGDLFSWADLELSIRSAITPEVVTAFVYSEGGKWEPQIQKEDPIIYYTIPDEKTITVEDIVKTVEKIKLKQNQIDVCARIADVNDLKFNFWYLAESGIDIDEVYEFIKLKCLDRKAILEKEIDQITICK